jgi:alkylation response protein AidB-like acyl-CoA dehydrogenase
MMADGELCKSAVERLLDEAIEPVATALFVRAKERAARAATDGVQLLGGYGYMEEYGQERCMRDAKQAQYLLGRPELLRQDAMERWVRAGAEL